ncbi:P-loop containing nucleoside triphosphate hydrolase protein [Coccomyxa subellipsoidea C-169]|uniref:Structural maintenance of chromosomes protein 5 n=1 Tax=Coccomyxa subellipsoidea (strain C-169) TaxID=574566 RepID=I0Z8T4_COCSC|nr:P-loop containing nucleoside triphosphate hydrolase protein [Coccomyxa subellipsoidea C-169]EIE27053.1 P-loop containing nucleoside triphosphate hydrolase protein [Coccomyxa subellipsoidea C-169]|eukprot:XP_005651597.1 P-loop containing nucleoside triphosphate hydrolase protein [Coccomyxa subellipsoidea C-169]
MLFWDCLQLMQQELGHLLASVRRFEKGSIIKIRVKNFMTYDEAVFNPGPRLNLVLAPNGTGKSSLTCALCLGLAGHPNILARADDQKDFIRKGTNEAMTEITLSSGNPLRPIVIHRRLTRESSKYKINGVDKTKADVLKVLKDLNIQLDNLCQFLPQDRVAAFALMKPGQLLMESERAMGDARLHKLHLELIEDRNTLKTYERTAGALQRRLEEEERHMGELQRDKERYDQRRQLEEQADLLEKKNLYMDFQEAQDKLRETNARLVQGRQRLQEIKDEIARDAAPLVAKLAEEGRLKTSVLSQKRGLIEKQNLAETFMKKSDNLVQQLKQKWDAIDGLKAQAEQQAQQVAKLEADVAKLQADLDELPGESSASTQGSQAAPSEEILALKKQVADLNTEAREFDGNVYELRDQLHTCEQEMKHWQEQLARLDSVRDNKLRFLEQRNRGITAFAHWVTENKARFKGDVYGPILLEVTVADQQHAKYLEQQLPGHIWTRFVTVYREDQDELRREAQRRKVHITTSNYTGSVTAPLQHPDGPASQYANFGITHTLDEVFEAPPVIKRILNDESSITRAYVGTARTDVDAFLRANATVTNLYTPESNHRIRVSLYNSAARSQQVKAIKQQCDWLGGARDDKDEPASIDKGIRETQQAMDAMKSEMHALNAGKREAETRVAEKRRELKKLEDAFNTIKRKRLKLVSSLNGKKKLLADVKKKPDPLSREPGLRRDVDRFNTQCHNLVQKVAVDLKAQWTAMTQHACSEAHLLELQAQIAALRDRNQGSNDRQRKLENLLVQLQHGKELDLKELKRRKKIANDACELTNEIREQFQALPADRDELRARMDDLHRQAAAIQCANPRVMQEYEDRLARIRTLREDVGKETDMLQGLTAALEAKKAQWLPELQRMVGVINAQFGRNLRSMGCAGEVSLFCGCEAGFDACNNFDKYAVHIRVRFRDDEELQLLTANRQSGGERSVCTILYIIALQHVTVCPFRVVDEINQGMDQINERKVFVQMVEAACREGTPQCFMFTPKLLPDLPYTRDVYPMSIFNGVLAEPLTDNFQEDSFVAGMPVVYKG